MNINDMFDLTNRVAIVTGGCGNLGSEFVTTLHDAGATVVIIDNVPESKQLHKFYFEPTIYRVDITHQEAIRCILLDILKNVGKPSILINCAAIDVPPSNQSNESMFKFDNIIDVNIKGTVNCSLIFGEYMEQEHNNGSIINISSIYGEVSPDQRIYIKDNQPDELPFVKPISYCISKGAIPNMTRYLATYFKNVRVNTLTLGGVFNNQNTEFVKKYSDKVPLGRMANNDEYNGAILFLASNASSYMTGSNLIIDGGYTAW